MNFFRNRIRRHSPVVLPWIGLLFLITAGCDLDTAAEHSPPGERVRPVKAVQIQPDASRIIRSFPGTAKALQDTKLSFRVGGPLIELDAATGRRAVKGAPIARIDPRDFLVRLRTATANLASSRAKLEEAESQFHRYEALIKEKASARAHYDQIKAAYEMAAAQVTADAKQEENARNALHDTLLPAPFTGYIQNEYVENHETVTAGQSIVSMVDLSKIEIVVPLPEDFLPQTQRFLSFSCRFDALPQQQFPATFKEIAKQPNSSAGTYPLTLVLDQTTSDMSAPVRPGMAAEISITISNEHNAQCFIVPVGAVVCDHTEQSFVWCIDRQEERVFRQPVTISAVTGAGMSIEAGLMPGQWIVSAGAPYLSDRQRVRILEKPSTSNIGAEL